MFLVSPKHVCKIPWGILVEEHPSRLQQAISWTRWAKELAWEMLADAAAEWTSKWLRSNKAAAKNNQKKHTGTSNVAKPGFVLAGCWQAAGSDFWRRELPPVVSGTVPSFVFKQIGWHAVNIWLLLAKLSHKTLNTNYLLSQKEHDLFIYYLFTLLW